MNIVFTPFNLIITLVTLLIIFLLWLLIGSGKYKTAGTILGIIVILVFTNPIKLTTGTDKHNKNVDQHIMENHKRVLEELPPRVIVERKSYNDILSEETKNIKER